MLHYIQNLFLKQNVEPSSLFLSVNDENTLKRHFEFVMKSFCNEFVPPMPPYVFVSQGSRVTNTLGKPLFNQFFFAPAKKCFSI